jgi:hypothetical protein
MRPVLPACFLSLALAFPAARQDETARSSAPPTPAEGKLVAMSGCLSGGPSSFTLESVTVTDGAHDRPNLPVGTTGTTITSYSLRGRDGVNLSPHVGKKVEIRGVLLTPAAARPSAGESAEKPKRDDSPDVKVESDAKVDSNVAAVMRPNVAVTSVRVLSASCR